MENEKSQEQIARRIAHLDEHRNSQLVREVLLQDTTFKKEVEDFYDLKSWREYYQAGLSRMAYDLKPEKTDKIKQFPAGLVELLNPFSEKEFDASKLRYEDVRRDYLRWNCGLRDAKGLLTFLGLQVGSVASLLTGVGSALFGKPEIAIPAGIAGVGLGYLYFKYRRPDPKGTNDELGEYLRLCETAKRADSFIPTYRNHLLEKVLEK